MTMSFSFFSTTSRSDAPDRPGQWISVLHTLWRGWLDGWIRGGGGAAVEERKSLHLSSHPSSRVKFERARIGRNNSIFAGGRSSTYAARARSNKGRSEERANEKKKKKRLSTSKSTAHGQIRLFAIGL
jgi:hypothetical protein